MCKCGEPYVTPRAASILARTMTGSSSSTFSSHVKVGVALKSESPRSVSVLGRREMEPDELESELNVPLLDW